MTIENIKEDICLGIPSTIPIQKVEEAGINHAPKRKDILSTEEKKLSLKNALRYFEDKHHPVLIKEF